MKMMFLFMQFGLTGQPYVMATRATIWSISHSEERKKHTKEYLEFYHQILVQTLEKLNEDPNVYPLR